MEYHEKYVSVILVLLALLMLCACGAEQAPESKAITDYNIDGNMEVYSCSYYQLNNGNTQYTLEYTAPEGRYITVFNPLAGIPMESIPITVLSCS